MRSETVEFNVIWPSEVAASVVWGAIVVIGVFTVLLNLFPPYTEHTPGIIAFWLIVICGFGVMAPLISRIPVSVSVTPKEDIKFWMIWGNKEFHLSELQSFDVVDLYDEGDIARVRMSFVRGTIDFRPFDELETLTSILKDSNPRARIAQEISDFRSPAKRSPRSG